MFLMPHWPLLLPPPAAPMLPSRSHRYSSSIAVKLPSRRPLQLRHAIHHRQVAIVPSIAVHHNCARGQLPFLSRCSLSRSLCTIHCRRATPSIIVKETSIAIHCCPLPSICPLLSSCRSAVHRRPSPSIPLPLVAVAPSIAVHYPSPFRRCCAVHCCPRHRAVYCRQIANAPSHRTLVSSIHHRRAVNCCRAVNRCRAVHYRRALNCCLLTMWYGTTV